MISMVSQRSRVSPIISKAWTAAAKRGSPSMASFFMERRCVSKLGTRSARSARNPGSKLSLSCARWRNTRSFARVSAGRCASDVSWIVPSGSSMGMTMGRASPSTQLPKADATCGRLPATRADAAACSATESRMASTSATRLDSRSVCDLSLRRMAAMSDFNWRSDRSSAASLSARDVCIHFRRQRLSKRRSKWVMRRPAMATWRL
mmetsp:Transcript_10114/g.34896  ORF Transcript_10114/g.34896 Transcript_10114/m.34896 type:complete len:206 (-) Transcript_10114:93-710(-)